MATRNYPITGPPALSPAPVDGSVPLRRELRDLQWNYPDQWNLYILGLDAFQKQDGKSDLSYYGIAGIHGRPYRPWGGVNGDKSAVWQGYCTHSSILFAPWHRPYLSLFEQTLYAAVQKIANQFPVATRARYQQAATNFRMPYWDWAAQPLNGDRNFPTSVGRSASISVITPQSNGQAVMIPNPLYSYKFAPLNPVSGDFSVSPFDRWPQTLRYPNSTRSPGATTQTNQIFAAVASQFLGLQQNVNILLNDPNYRAFDAFSNHVWQINRPGTAASLEDIHDSIHGIVGGNRGHMSELDYSAFDPVFWLHHTNVDRLFAIWQALNPTSYTINKSAGDGNFVTAAGSIETATTPLAPFYDASGTKFWDSQRVRSTSTFNYAYPETQRWAFGSDALYVRSVKVAVQRLYDGVGRQLNAMTASAAPPTASLGETSERLNAMSLSANMPTASPGPMTSNDAAAPKPMQSPIPTQNANAAEHKAPADGHPFRDALNKVKMALHRNSEGSEGTRELDLEAEIGKGNSRSTDPALSLGVGKSVCPIQASVPSKIKKTLNSHPKSRFLHRHQDTAFLVAL